jgi:hypothetical protein
MRLNRHLWPLTPPSGWSIAFVIMALALSFARGQEVSAWSANHLPLDLTRFYSQTFSNLPAGKPWSQVPRGPQTLDGVPFLIGGKLEVTGIDAARHGDVLPSRVAGIPVRQRAARLQVLHGAAHGRRDGTPMAKLVLHYANGQSRALRLAYGLHARNWIREPGERAGRPDDPNSRLAWTANGTAGDAFEGTLRFYRTPLDNPLPDVEITSLDVVSLFSHATPILFGITLEKAGPPLLPVSAATSGKCYERAYEFSDSVYTRDLVVQATGADGRTELTNATANLTITDNEASFFLGEVRADARGRATLSYPVPETVLLGVQVRAPGFVPETIVKAALDRGGIPEEFQVQLQRGVRIGGTVLNDLGEPLEGADVFICRAARTGPAEYTQTAFDAAVTDHAGRWSSTSVPRDFSGFRFELAHPDFKPTTYLQHPEGASNELQVTAADLLAGKAILRMAPHIYVAGSVLDALGRPVAEAQVFLRMGSPTARYSERFRQQARTDREGAFDITVPERGEGTIGVIAPGLAPEYRPVRVGPGLKPLRFALGKGTPLRVRVLDQDGQPVPAAQVSLASWNNLRIILWSTRTDDDGRFTWTNAPPGVLSFSIYKNDYLSAAPALGSPSDRELAVTLRRNFRVSGAVLDAETGELLDRATATPGRRATSDDAVRWQRGFQVRSRKGQLSLPFSNEPATEALVLVEAPGYLPAIVGPFGKAGSYTNDVKLKRGQGLSGDVLTPGGLPAAKAALVLLEEGETAQMDYAPAFRRSNYVGSHDSADREGRFEFPPRLGARTVLAAHATGFAEITAAEVAKARKIQLQPWGCVRGRVQIGTNLPPNLYVALHNLQPRLAGVGQAPSPFSLLLRTRLDWRGNFLFQKVPPGEWRASLLLRYRDVTGEPLPFSHGVPVVVKPGETSNVILGGPGRALTGRVQVTQGDPADVDWFRDAHLLSLQVPGTPEFTPPNRDRAKTEVERLKLQREFSQRVRAFWASEPGRALSWAHRSYALAFDSNGVFRVEAVPPGTYELTITPTDPTRDYLSSEPLGSVTQKVVVAEAGAGEPLDLGVIPLAIRSVVRVGEPAPPVKLKTFTGQPVQLEDYRGRFVVLDFWDTSTESRSSDLELLKSLETEEALTNQFVIVGLNLDRDSRLAETYLRVNPSSGPQCHLGAWTNTKVPAQFGLETNAAAVVVLDREGRIASKPVRSDYIRTTVRRVVNGQGLGP